MAQFLTVVNRTSKTLHGLWDGIHYDLAPGKHSFPSVQARKFREQNPLMGSADPQTLAMAYLIGVEEDGDDCTPLEQSNAIEQWNRKVMGGPGTEVIKGNGGLFATERRSDIGQDSGFVKP